MAKFAFNLDPVLNVRKQAEQAQQRALAELHRERIALEDVLRLHQQHIDASRGSLRDNLVGTVQVRDLRGQAAATMRLMAKAQKLAIDLAGVHKRIEQAQEQLRDAMKNRRAMELLRDKRFAQWKAKHDKAEQAMMDELAVTASARGPVQEIAL